MHVFWFLILFASLLETFAHNSYPNQIQVQAFKEEPVEDEAAPGWHCRQKKGLQDGAGAVQRGGRM